MLHVRTIARAASASASGAVLPRAAPRAARLAALGLLGLSIGAGGAILTVSVSQAENDGSVRAVLLDEARRRQANQPRPVAYAQPVVYASNRAQAPAVQVHAYAPAERGFFQRLFDLRPDGRLAPPPPVNLNPFQPAQRTQRSGEPRVRAAASQSDGFGASGATRTFCVRLCDGFYAPIGQLRGPSDLRGHEALCQAANPGIPVRVFRLAAGADSIDEATSKDGRRYSALPVARAHETSADPACRPAIVAAGERRVSLLRDFTLRPGDSVVLDGRVKTFAGASRFPYSPRDFEDFRASADLSRDQRRQIDERVGISRMEAQMTSLRRQMRQREASLQIDAPASDADTLRGTLDPRDRGGVRVIPISR